MLIKTLIGFSLFIKFYCPGSITGIFITEVIKAIFFVMPGQDR